MQAGGEFGAALHAELAKGRAQVMADRMRAQTLPGSRLFGRFSRCHECGRGVLAQGESVQPGGESTFERALALFAAGLPPRHPSLVSCRKNYARLRRELAAARRAGQA